MDITENNNNVILDQYNLNLVELKRQRDKLSDEISKLSCEIEKDEEEYRNIVSEKNNFMEKSEVKQQKLEGALFEIAELRKVFQALSSVADEKKRMINEQEYEISEALSKLRNSIIDKTDLKERKKVRLRDIELQITSLVGKINSLEV